MDDVDTVFELLSTIEEFSPPLKETIAKTLKTGAGRIYMLTDEAGKAVSIAQTTAENSVSAMIIGVCTLAEHRKKRVYEARDDAALLGPSSRRQSFEPFLFQPGCGENLSQYGF